MHVMLNDNEYENKRQKTTHIFIKNGTQKHSKFNTLKGKFSYRSVLKMIHTTEHHAMFFLSKNYSHGLDYHFDRVSPTPNGVCVNTYQKEKTS